VENAERIAQFEESYARAHDALQAGDAVTAERELRRIQASWPGEIRSLRLLGLSALAQGRVGQAIALLEQVVAAAPRYQAAHVDLARACRRDGLLVEAVAALERALALADDALEPWYLLGDLRVNLGEFAAANHAYERALALDPRLPDLKRAALESEKPDGGLAEVILRQILAAEPRHIGALCALAQIASNAGRFEDAQRLLALALKRARHMPLIWRAVASTLAEAGRPLEAAVAQRRACLIDPAAGELPR
jgi:cytochrome c-type biogenesis protein CcmH/NrfG